MPEILAADLTPTDLVGLGLDAVNERLPVAVLVAAARKYVALEQAKRRRSEARRVEQRAHGENPAIRTRVRAIPARLAALAAGETSWVPTSYQTRVSQRNWLPLDVVEVNGEPVVLERA